MSKNASFKEGDIVFAKVKGYPAWPARVIATGSGKYPVLFFGTNESANCKGQDVFDFTEFKEKYGKNTKPAFLKAMREANEAIVGGEGGTDGEEEEESNSGKRRKRSNSTGKGKKGGKKEESNEEESEEEAPKKKAKPTPKPKKAQPTKKTPAKRATKKKAKSENESEEDDEPLSKAVTTKPASKTAARASRGGGRRKVAKVVSYADKDSDDSEKDNRKKNKLSKRKKDKSDSESEGSADSKDSDSESEDSVKSSENESEEEVSAKPAKKAPAARKPRANKSNTKPKKATPARKGRGTKKKPAESSDGEESDKGDSDKESEKSSHSSSSSSSSSSASSRTSSNASQHSDTEENESKAKAGSVSSPQGDKENTEIEESKKQTEDESSKEKPTSSESGDAEGLAVSKEHVTDIPDAQSTEGQQESATNSSVEDDEVIHSSRAHKSHSKHAVLSESDSDEEGKPKEEKGLEEMLEERKKEHQELKLKRRQEKMEERRRRQEAREKEQEEERKQKEEKKKQHQQRIRTEKRIRDLDDIIKRSLAVSTKDIPKCIDAMNELDNLSIVAAMLVKYPAIIDTLKKCRKYKADSDVMTKAESLCNKLRDIATSDRTAITALNKQKSGKQKMKKEETNEDKPDGKTQEVTPVESTNEPKTVSGPNVTNADSTTDNKDSSSLQPAITQSDNHDQPSQVVDMDIDNDTQVTSSTNIDTQVARDHTHTALDTSDSVVPTDSHELTTTIQTTSNEDQIEDLVAADTKGTDSKPASPPMFGSVSDLKVMAKDELPSEDALAAGIQALIANAQESSAMLDQVIKQKKDKRMSSSSSRKRRKLDSGLHHHETSRSSQLHRHPSSASRPSVTVTKSASPTKPVEKLGKLPTRKTADYDDIDIHDLLGI